MKEPTELIFGTTTLRLDGATAVIGLRRVPALSIRIPARRVEQWLLRRLRDETMRPEKAST